MADVFDFDNGPKVRTSQTHPITLSWIIPKFSAHNNKFEEFQRKEGSVGLCYCPGKKVVRNSITWSRSLSDDLARLRDHFKITTVLCLLNDYELRTYKVVKYGAGVEAAGLNYIQFPIVEMAAPDSLDDAAALIEDLHDRVKSGESIAIHCRGGVGRAGTVASMLLIRFGLVSANKPELQAIEAIKTLRARRCKQAVESRRQEQFILQYAKHVFGGKLISSEAENIRVQSECKLDSTMEPPSAPREARGIFSSLKGK